MRHSKLRQGPGNSPYRKLSHYPPLVLLTCAFLQRTIFLAFAEVPARGLAFLSRSQAAPKRRQTRRFEMLGPKAKTKIHCQSGPMQPQRMG
jgi:hypothetical protein